MLTFTTLEANQKNLIAPLEIPQGGHTGGFGRHVALVQVWAHSKGLGETCTLGLWVQQQFVDRCGVFHFMLSVFCVCDKTLKTAMSMPWDTILKDHTRVNL